MGDILIVGGGGMVGQKLAHALARDGLGPDAAPQVTLFDLGFPEAGAPAAQRVAGSVTDAEAIARLLAARPQTIFHLAAIVSGEAEANFDLGWRINALAFWGFLDALRAEHLASGGTWRPRVVFTSSIAVFGGPYPEKIDDSFPLAPQTSYGAQKAVAETMLADLHRRDILDGIAIRLPTICVRPGKPNKAASSFFSGIVREPLNGQEAILPVSRDVRHWHASPRAAVGFLRHAATMDLAPLGTRIALNLPGVSCTVAEQIDALRAVAGAEAVARIREEPDETIMRIVAGWPRNFAPERAVSLGFRGDPDFRSIVETYIADDLPAGAKARLPNR